MQESYKNYVNTTGYKIGGGENKEITAQSSNVNNIAGRYVVYTFKDKKLAQTYVEKLRKLQEAKIPTIGSEESNLDTILSKKMEDYRKIKIADNKIFVLDLRHSESNNLVFSRFSDSEDQFKQFISSFVDNPKGLEIIMQKIEKEALSLAKLCAENGFWIPADCYTIIFNQLENKTEVIIGDLDTVQLEPIETMDGEDIYLYNKNRASRYLNVLRRDLKKQMEGLQNEIK